MWMPDRFLRPADSGSGSGIFCGADRTEIGGQSFNSTLVIYLCSKGLRLTVTPGLCNSSQSFYPNTRADFPLVTI